MSTIEITILFIILMVSLMVIALLYGLTILKTDIAEANLRLKEIRGELIELEVILTAALEAKP